VATVIETISSEREGMVTRFDVHQRIQHLLLMVSFILLVLTGLPIKYHDWAISQWWVDVWRGIETIRLVHHLAAYLMITVCVYHLVYIGYSTLILKRPFPIKMLPTTKDGKDLVQEIGYFIGIRSERPEFDRFNWRDKFDYWAIFWGLPVMGISGFIMLYPVFATDFLPGWVVPAALIAHSDEAMLALGWIFLVHIFFNHFSPLIFPVNKSIFTGRVPAERYKHEHPLEYKKLTDAISKKEES